MFGTIIFGTEFMVGTIHQLFLMHCAEDKMRRPEHTSGAEHIVLKFNGAEYRIPPNNVQKKKVYFHFSWNLYFYSPYFFNLKTKLFICFLVMYLS